MPDRGLWLDITLISKCLGRNREFGIPTVLRIEGATRLIRDGQLLRVDGGKGTVKLLDA